MKTILLNTKKFFISCLTIILISNCGANLDKKQVKESTFKKIVKTAVVASLFTTTSEAFHYRCTSEVVYDDGNVGQFSSLQLNDLGYPVISYFDEGGDNLNLAVCVDPTCTNPATITEVDTPGNVGEFTSLKLNSLGYPVISYSGRSTSIDLKLAICNDTACTTPTITTVDNTTNNAGQYTSLQLNDIGYPVISYYDLTTQSLKLAVCDDAVCTTSTITTVDNSSIDLGITTSLQLNDLNYPIISYYDRFPNKNLKLAVCNDLTCTTPTIRIVDASGDVGLFPSLKLNDLGYPVISYYEGSSGGRLKLAVCNDATCSSSTITIIDSNNVGKYNSLQFNDLGYPVISYFDDSSDDLKLAVCNDPTCFSSHDLIKVDTGGIVGQYTSLKLRDIPGGLKEAVISYYEVSSGGKLKLAVCTPFTPETCNATTSTQCDVAQYNFEILEILDQDIDNSFDGICTKINNLETNVEDSFNATHTDINSLNDTVHTKINNLKTVVEDRFNFIVEKIKSIENFLNNSFENLCCTDPVSSPTIRPHSSSDSSSRSSGSSSRSSGSSSRSSGSSSRSSDSSSSS